MSDKTYIYNPSLSTKDNQNRANEALGFGKKKAKRFDRLGCLPVTFVLAVLLALSMYGSKQGWFGTSNASANTVSPIVSTICDSFEDGHVMSYTDCVKAFYK